MPKGLRCPHDLTGWDRDTVYCPSARRLTNEEAAALWEPPDQSWTITGRLWLLRLLRHIPCPPFETDDMTPRELWSLGETLAVLEKGAYRG